MENLDLDRKTFKAMRKNGKRLFPNDETIEAFLRLGLTPGATNRVLFEAAGPGAFTKGLNALDTMDEFGIKGGIVEDIMEFFPNGVSKFKNVEL